MKNNKGITLITLVVTVIILLILASVGTYSGIRAIKLGELNRFTAELKIMQTEVNSMYEKFKNNETINEQEILSIGEEISSDIEIQGQANIVFTENASGITSSVGYKYYSLETISNLGIEGITQDFFVNIQTRSVVSYKGLEYNETTYYTLSQIPNGLYNVEYNDENTTIDPEMDSVTVEKIDNATWKLTVNDITYGGYIQKGKIQYQRLGDDYWSESNDKSFIVAKQGIYIIKIIDNAGNESDNIIKYVGNVEVTENTKVTIPGVKEVLDDNQINIEYKKQNASTWKNDLTENYFIVSETGMYDIKFTKNSGETDSILIYIGEINFNSSSTNSWDFSVQENNYKLKYKTSEKNGNWQESNNNVAQISEAGTYDFKVIDNNGNESNNILTQYAYVKDGLVLCYDGINNTGTGHSSVATTWKDLSGNNNDTSLNANHTFSSSTNGLECQKVVGAYSQSQNNVFTTRPENFTIEAVAKFNSTANGWIWSIRDSGTANGVQSGQYQNYQFFDIYGSNKTLEFRPENKIQLKFNRTIVYKNQGNTIVAYDNNNVINTRKIYDPSENEMIGMTELEQETVVENKKFKIGGTEWYNGSALDGSIYAIRVYNRALTESEIKENYKIDKIRYNID